ncbi:hypothetical protein HYH02_003817 [Chlamydomonas schloesseri]|uniref:Calmodulin-lysine N-methyltransferase n=1 Tax=Chlamydomonas schloesseri TaxID=2026947 RepID=A0A835WPD5_9CHLO|nr:hypothetical protein HYH02_003817 [Chlamydomonas schloesseri]|eukprot:KAG2451210.1 hypothetical protein HYH02_003817 [Chlamydomonas schloesseri]
MQREEVCVEIGPTLKVRLLQRPPQVPPMEEDDFAAAGGALQCATAGAEGSGVAAEPGSRAGLLASDCLLGWELWPAATTLALFLTNPEGRRILKAAARVVELGAGLGLPGIVAAALGAPRVTLTDLPQALPLAAANARLNGVAGACTAAPLDWGEVARLAARPGGAGAAAGEVRAAAAAAGAVDGTADAQAVAAGPESSGAPCPVAEGRTEGRRPRERSKQVQQAQGLAPASPPSPKPPPPPSLPQPPPPPPMPLSPPPAAAAAAAAHLGAYDLVLAADVVYVSALAPLLADTISAVAAPAPAPAPAAATAARRPQLSEEDGAPQIIKTQHAWPEKKDGAVAAQAQAQVALEDEAGGAVPADTAPSDAGAGAGAGAAGGCSGAVACVGGSGDADVGGVRPVTVVLVAHTTRKSVWLDRGSGQVVADDTDEPWERFLGCMRGHGFQWRRVEVEGRMCEESFVGVFTRREV